MTDEAAVVVCVEHLWLTAAVTLAADGSHIEHVCARCGALAVEGPDELAGRA